MNILSGVRSFKAYSSIELLEEALKNEEGCLAADGQLWVPTGEFTGRAAQDKYLVDNLKDVSFGVAGKSFTTDQMWWLSESFQSYLSKKDLYVVYFKAGGKTCKLVSEKAWHCLFAKNMFLECELSETSDLTIIDAPGFQSDPAIHGTNSKTVIACDFAQGLVLIGGTHYAGEIKKSVFSYVSYLSPESGVLPMHSSVTTDSLGSNTTVFFGLSGTGKTTLSAFDGARLLGDDEHLWSNGGITNIESGCYAKAIRLSPEKEPLIWKACHQFKTILENVAIAGDKTLDFNDSSITENTRAAYPLSYIQNSHAPLTMVGHPKNIIMLTCDAYGVLPGVSKLDRYSAAYHFISGYTAKVAGTEKGLTEPLATFSQCFGGPFMAKRVDIYANLLMEKIDRYQPDVWLVNTGWVGGGPGVGQRMDIDETRNIIAMIVSGELKNRKCFTNNRFNLKVPEDTYNSRPRSMWSDLSAYDSVAATLIQKFQDNEQKFNDISGLADVLTRGGIL